MIKSFASIAASTFALTLSASALAYTQASYVGVDGALQTCSVNLSTKDDGSLLTFAVNATMSRGILVGPYTAAFSADGIQGELGNLAVLGSTTLTVSVPSNPAQDFYTLEGSGYDALSSVSYSRVWIVPIDGISGSCSSLTRVN